MFVGADVPAELQRQVQDGALEEIRQWGIERFSVEAVAARCGVDAAVIYQHWGDRETVLLYVLFSYSESFMTVPDTGSLRNDLRELALSVAGYLNTDAGRTLLRAVLPWKEDSHSENVRGVFWGRRMGGARVVFDRAVARGEISGDVPATTALAILVSPIHVRALYLPEQIDEEFCITMADLTWRALTNRIE